MKKSTKIIFSIFLILLITLIYILYKNHLEVVENNEIIKNVTQVESLNKKNVQEIERKLKDLKIKNNINSGSTTSHRQTFEDALFMGDSQTEPLALYEILSPSNVLAKVGQNLSTANKPENLDKLPNLNPKRIFLLYGLNDLTRVGFTDKYISDYDALIMKVKAKVPEAKIFIISILPVEDRIVSKVKEYAPSNIAKYNLAIEKYCKDKGYKYVDATSILKNDKSFYEPDGEHFKKSFYPVYLDLIRQETENIKE